MVTDLLVLWALLRNSQLLLYHVLTLEQIALLTMRQGWVLVLGTVEVIALLSEDVAGL